MATYDTQPGAYATGMGFGSGVTGGGPPRKGSNLPGHSHYRTRADPPRFDPVWTQLGKR